MPEARRHEHVQALLNVTSVAQQSPLNFASNTRALSADDAREASDNQAVRLRGGLSNLVNKRPLFLESNKRRTCGRRALRLTAAFAAASVAPQTRPANKNAHRSGGRMRASGGRNGSERRKEGQGGGDSDC